MRSRALPPAPSNASHARLVLATRSPDRHLLLAAVSVILAPLPLPARSGRAPTDGVLSCLPSSSSGSGSSSSSKLKRTPASAQCLHPLHLEHWPHRLHLANAQAAASTRAAAASTRAAAASTRAAIVLLLVLIVAATASALRQVGSPFAAPELAASLATVDASAGAGAGAGAARRPCLLPALLVARERSGVLCEASGALLLCVVAEIAGRPGACGVCP